MDDAAGAYLKTIEPIFANLLVKQHGHRIHQSRQRQTPLQPQEALAEKIALAAETFRTYPSIPRLPVSNV